MCVWGGGGITIVSGPGGGSFEPPDPPPPTPGYGPAVIPRAPGKVGPTCVRYGVVCKKKLSSLLCTI